MPDGMIINQTTATPRSKRSSAKDEPLLSADQMRPLWDAVDAAVKNYREEDEERSGAAILDAQDRIARARTVDPIGIAYKLKATRTWADQSKGLAEALKSPDRTERTIATIIRDVEAVTTASPLARPIPSRLRPLWEAYAKHWQEVMEAMDGEDAAMQARPADAAPGTTEAERQAKERRASAGKAFDAATAALQEAPTRTFDDALCRIEHAIDLADESTDADLINSLNKALRVLRKVYSQAACVR